MTILSRMGRDAAYTFLGLPLAVVAFGLVIPLFSAGVGTLVLFIGFPILAAMLLVSRGFADIERVRLEHVTGRATRRPRYEPAPPAAGWFRRMINPMRSPQSWLDRQPLERLSNRPPPRRRSRREWDDLRARRHQAGQ